MACLVLAVLLPRFGELRGATTQPGQTAPASRATQPVAAATQDAAATAESAGPVVPVESASATRRSPLPSFTVDAMIGQVNGQALYASRILNPLDEQLKKLGQSGSRKEFSQEARAMIRSRLEQIVLPSLLVGEAERALTDAERQRLDFIMKEQRAELLRRYGQGSLELADKTLREQMGKGFEQTLNEKRESVLIAGYMTRKLLPKVNITQRDVERYYRQHSEEFNRPPGRTVHMIVADDPGTAERVDTALAAGTPFLTVAADPALNRHEPASAGLLHRSISGDNIFGDATLNAATLALGAGENTPRMQVGSRYYWVYVDAISTGQHVTLAEAQVEIERKLVARQRQILSNEYRRRLLQEGSYNPLSEMEDAVLEVAMSRYLQPR